MSHDDGQAPGGPKSSLDKLSSRLGQISIIIGIIIGFNSALTTCNQQTAARHTQFREVVDSEQEYWERLYSQYLDAISQDVGEQRTAKLFAIQALAGHIPPDFEAYTIDFFDSGETQKSTREYFERMRKSLVDALNKAQSSETSVAQAGQEATFRAEEATVRSGTNARSPIKTDETLRRVAENLTGTLSYEAKTLTSNDAEGWDIDVFWCAGTNENQLYTTAFHIGSKLAALANARSLLSPGNTLGRVRVRALPATLQGKGYPISTNEIRHDSGEGEKELANLINKMLADYKPAFQLKDVNSPTPWYLSIFVCDKYPTD